MGTASTFSLTDYHIGGRIETVPGLRRLSKIEERLLFDSKSAASAFDL